MAIRSEESVALRTDFSLLIGGELVQSGQHLDVINPALGTVFARCPAAQAPELDRAVDAARRAFPAWRARSFADRAALVKRLSQKLRERQAVALQRQLASKREGVERDLAQR